MADNDVDVNDEHERERFERVFRRLLSRPCTHTRLAASHRRPSRTSSRRRSWSPGGGARSSRSEPLPWLYGIARRVAREPSARQRPPRGAAAASAHRTSGERGRRARRTRSATRRRARRRCGERDREALRLVAWEGLDHRDGGYARWAAAPARSPCACTAPGAGSRVRSRAQETSLIEHPPGSEVTAVRPSDR